MFCNSETGLEDVQSYPNPVSKILIIEMPREAVYQHVQIYNARGKLMDQINDIRMKKNNEMFRSIINVSKYTPGLYYLRLINSASSAIITKSFIIVP